MFLHTAESTFQCFFFKLIIYVVVMVIRHLEINKMTGASLGFGRVLLSASYNISLMSVLTSMYDNRALSLALVEEEMKTLFNEDELNDMREDAKKKEEHFYPVMSPVQLNQAVARISAVQICSGSFSRPHYTQTFLLVTIISQCSPIQKKTSNSLRLLVWISPPILSSPSALLSFPFLKYSLTQFCLTKHPPHLYNILAIPQLKAQTLLLLHQLDYSSQFLSTETILL